MGRANKMLQFEKYGTFTPQIPAKPNLILRALKPG